MSFALSAAVTGLQAHQQMLDIAGNNLANVNTTAYKSTTVVFADLLSETIKKATQPTATVGGTNPQQMGSGVGIAGIVKDMSQGNIVSTGRPLDLALEGEGYFVLNDGEQDLYTRIGSFSVDANSRLVDPATGYLVQRAGSVGESDGFQTPGNNNVQIPYGTALPATKTTSITVGGNLSSDGTTATKTSLTTGSGYAFTVSGAAANADTLISALEQFSGAFGAGETGTLTAIGTRKDGTTIAYPDVRSTLDVDATTKLSDVITWLNGDTTTASAEEQSLDFENKTPTAGSFTLDFTVGTDTQTTAALDETTTASDLETALGDLSNLNAADVTVTGTFATDFTVTFDKDLGDVSQLVVNANTLVDGGGAIAITPSTTTAGAGVYGILGGAAKESTASLANGEIRIADDVAGFSELDIKLTYTQSSTGTDALELPGYMQMLTAGGNETKNATISIVDRGGGKHTFSVAFVRTDTANTWDMVITSISGEISEITNRRVEDMSFSTAGAYTGLSGTDTAQLTVTFANDTANPQTITASLGSVGAYDGLTQFAGTSTAVITGQNGYEDGRLSTLSINNTGVIVGAFTNGIKKDLATIKIALFQNTSGLESIGNGYVLDSANSGTPTLTTAMAAGAGAIHGGSLEKSNVDVASEFVNLIKAQNGFQANARTIRVANDVLRELTNLIR